MFILHIHFAHTYFIIIVNTNYHFQSPCVGIWIYLIKTSCCFYQNKNAPIFQSCSYHHMSIASSHHQIIISSSHIKMSSYQQVLFQRLNCNFAHENASIFYFRSYHYIIISLYHHIPISSYQHIIISTYHYIDISSFPHIIISTGTFQRLNRKFTPS